MWIYQQNHTFTDQAAESVRQLPVPAVQGNCCSPEPGREPESQIRTHGGKGSLASGCCCVIRNGCCRGHPGAVQRISAGMAERVSEHLAQLFHRFWHAHRSAFCCGIFYIGNRGNGFTLVRLFCIWSSADFTFPDALWHRRRPADASSPERDKLEGKAAGHPVHCTSIFHRRVMSVYSFCVCIACQRKTPGILIPEKHSGEEPAGYQYSDTAVSSHTCTVCAFMRRGLRNGLHRKPTTLIFLAEQSVICYNEENALYEIAGELHERAKIENSICVFQLRGNKSPLDGALPELRQLEYHE